MANKKHKTTNNNKIGILGENIFINNRTIMAYYIIESLNYETLSFDGVRKHIDKLESMATTLSTQRPGIKFSIFNSNKVLTPDDVKKNMIDTVRLWDDKYEGIPEMFSKYITKSTQNYTLLAVQIETNMLDVEETSLKEIIKNYIGSVSQSLFSTSSFNIDSKHILDSEKAIYNIIKEYGVRASRELTFYNYISSMFPSYEISYNRNSFVEKNMTPILGAVKQEVKTHFGGYFEMSNTGVEMFGFPAQTTYGSVLNILEMPDRIDSDNFNLQIENLRVFIKTIPKDKAKLTMKRGRADIEFEEETAEDAGVRKSDMKYIDDHKDMAEASISNIDSGKMICEMNVSILVLSKTLEGLKSKRQSIISSLADADIIASPSLSQDTDFINNYVKASPFNSAYNHLCDLRYPLSFQIDNGVQVGDSYSNYESPSIGETL